MAAPKNAQVSLWQEGHNLSTIPDGEIGVSSRCWAIDSWAESLKSAEGAGVSSITTVCEFYKRINCTHTLSGAS